MDNHLDDITIGRFRGLRDLTLTGLGRVNLLVGLNNSGKTSVLEAILTYCRPLDLFQWVHVARSRDDLFPRPLAVDALRWLFPQAEIPNPETFFVGEAILTGTGTFPVSEARARYTEIQGVDEPGPSAPGTRQEGELADEGDGASPSLTPEAVHRGAELELSVALHDDPTSLKGLLSTRIEETVRIWENRPFFRPSRQKGPSLPSQIITPVSHRIGQFQVSSFTDITLEHAKDSLLGIIRELDRGILDLQILSPRGVRPVLYVQHERIGFAPLSAFGDGVRRTLMIALTLSRVRSGVLLIDEIETALHRSALNRVFGWLVEACSEFHVQLFATTHSLEAVDAILGDRPVHDDTVVGYRLGPTGTDTPVQRFGGELLYRLRHERGLDVR